jgi:signal transduction histidine kinase
MKISDNGKGIPPQRLKVPTSFGITSMQNRISSLNGTLDVLTKLGQGTTISVEIPTHGTTND